MTGEIPQTVRLRDTLPVSFDALPKILKKAVAIVEQEELPPEDQPYVTAISAWTIRPEKGKQYANLLGINEPCRMIFDKVANDPVLEAVCSEVATKLDKQLSPQAA